jgi:ADP-heptose:LPS heptosyltransferase
MANLKAISRRSLKQIIARCFILLDRCKVLITAENAPIDLNDIKKIAIVEMQGFGDALAVMPAAKALKEKFPNAKITFISQKVAKDLFRNSPLFEEIIPLGINKAKLGVADFIRTISKLRRVEYDLLIVPSWSLRHTVVSLLIRSKAKLGYLHDYSLRLTYHNDFPVEARGIATRKEAKYSGKEHIIVRALKTLEPLGIQNGEARYQIEVSPRERVYVSELLKRFGLNEDQHFIIISPGAVWKERAWSLVNWKRLIEMLSTENNLKFTVIGSAEEREACSFLCDDVHSFNLCGLLNL